MRQTADDIIRDQLRLCRLHDRPDLRRYWEAVREWVKTGHNFDIACRVEGYARGNGDPAKFRLREPGR